MHDNRLGGILAVAEVGRLHVRLHPLRVLGVLAHDEHERLDRLPAALPRVGQQRGLCALVREDAVRQHQLVAVLRRKVGEVDVLTAESPRRPRIPVGDRLRKRILVDDILEQLFATAFVGLRRRRQLQAEYRLQVVQGGGPTLGAVVVRLIHQEDEIVQSGQLVEERLPEILVQLTHLGVVLVELVDVEDEDPHVGTG